MWLLIFTCAIVCASVSVDASLESLAFRKCCPKTQSLMKISEFDSGDGRYECLDRDSAEMRYNISYSPLVVGDSVSIEHGIPEQCDELQMVQLTSAELDVRLMSTSHQCYDRLHLEVINGTLKPNIPKIVTLTCINNKTELFPNELTIGHVRKCCPKGQSYDMMYHLCRSSPQDSGEKWLINRLNVSESYIYEVENGLHCKSGEYAVELSEGRYSLSVEGSKLRVMVGSSDVRLMQGEWCMERDYHGQGMMARVCTRDCSAFGAFCVRKCCPIGHHYKTRRCSSLVSSCVPNIEDILFDISSYMDPLKAEYDDIGDVLGIRTNLRCTDGKVMLNRTLEEDQHKLTHDALLHSSVAINDDYCLETVDNRHCPDGVLSVTATICFIKAPQSKDFRVSFVVISISCVCLALTLVVYCALPELRNLHGRTLICHVSMMLLACSCLARVQNSQVPDTTTCTILGYGIYFGFVAAFAWLNVMCFDIWWTFGSVRTVQPLRKAGTERRRFIWYSLYAWSIAVLLTLIMFLLDRYPIARILDANIGNGTCWFGSIQNTEEDWAHYIYFVIPMGLVTCTNFVLWGLTARHCARVKSEVHRLQAGSVGDRAKRRFRVDRAKYVLTGKLWVVMGAGWISELLSTLASEPKWLWMIIDLINELQGVFIFLILVFKPKLYYLIRKRLGLEKPDAPKNGASSSARTSSTFLSRTISTDERTNLKISKTNIVKQP